MQIPWDIQTEVEGTLHKAERVPYMPGLALHYYPVLQSPDCLFTAALALPNSMQNSKAVPTTVKVPSMKVHWKRLRRCPACLR